MALTYLRLYLCLSFMFATGLAELVSHSFIVKSLTVTKLCGTRDIITVNDQFPGPTLYVHEGDTVEVKVFNYAQYNLTIHWHGIRQMRTAWADGPEFITQCPIRPGGSYTYRFTITDQEGTLWWHAHSSWLRATVYGALIIYPKEGIKYPFLEPCHEAPPIILGEWWNRNPIDVVNDATRTGAAPNVSDAFTINGQPGDLYQCSSLETYTLSVKQGNSYLLRIINAGLNTELFVSIANHVMLVVAVDASYTKPFETCVIMIGPGQTTDVILLANQPVGKYYIAAQAYASAQGVPFDNTTTTAIIEYETLDPLIFFKSPAMPNLPAFNDTATATKFSVALRSLASLDHPINVPQNIDENLFYTVGVGLLNCPPSQTCGGPNNTRFAASFNNISFVPPQTVSLLQAHYYGLFGVFSRDFPDNPPVQFDYTAQNVSRSLWSPVKDTKVKVFKYNTAVQIILQGTNIFAGENHPIHLHGYDFYIVGQGFGNYNPVLDPLHFNLIDPPMRNTVSVPVNGWAAIRFVADNPGMWLFHCHLDVHITWGLAMAFLVENGPHYLSSLEAPPVDLPLC
ncbi:hypothetical protein SUGI_0502450 [Cryptomeria japonica]|uniref:laccase-3 n=1 Tax=Cryptomeria japonica TaxID=3369 RepID=UPI002408EB80|nr:laccase-3 [Cryptomeria japonica]GLJ26187.1 hypothetical protein SUGI_0502450 [Cryptomeria japonica]